MISTLIIIYKTCKVSHLRWWCDVMRWFYGEWRLGNIFSGALENDDVVDYVYH